MRKGERQPQAKLTEAQVIAIRQRYAAGGISQLNLARLFGMSRSAVQLILQRKNWKHVN